MIRRNLIALSALALVAFAACDSTELVGPAARSETETVKLSGTLARTEEEGPDPNCENDWSMTQQGNVATMTGVGTCTGPFNAYNYKSWYTSRGYSCDQAPTEIWVNGDKKYKMTCTRTDTWS